MRRKNPGLLIVRNEDYNALSAGTQKEEDQQDCGAVHPLTNSTTR